MNSPAAALPPSDKDLDLSVAKASMLQAMGDCRRLGIPDSEWVELERTRKKYAGQKNLEDLLVSTADLVRARLGKPARWDDDRGAARDLAAVQALPGASLSRLDAQHAEVPSEPAPDDEHPSEAMARVRAALGEDVKPDHPEALRVHVATRALESLAPLPRSLHDRPALARIAGATGLSAKDLATQLAALRRPGPRRRGSAPVDAHNLTDLGNAKRLIALHGPDLRFCGPLGWLAWDGKRWRPDEKNVRVNRLAFGLPAAIRAEARQCQDPDRRKALLDHAEKTESARSLRDVVTLAQSLPGVPVDVEAIDCDPWLLNVENGTLDLRTGVLRPHERADLLTRLAPVTYDPAARSELWEQFLETVTVGKLDLGVYLQRIAGYCLTGDATEQCFFLLHGKGSNGKSTFVNVLAKICGDHARAAQFSTFLTRPEGGVRSDIARLRGARLVSAIESRSGGKLDEGLVKQLTGGDPVTACFKYRDEFEFTPQFKLLLAANEKPEIRGTDLGVWRRVKLVPFKASIQTKDKSMKERLLAEASGILAWAVGGCLAWQKDGLAEPEDVRLATEEYRQDEDVLRDFLEDCCLPDQNAEVGTSSLYRCYSDWAGRQGSRPLRHKTFTQRLENRPGLERLHARTGTVWRGLSILAMPGSPRSAENRTFPRQAD